MISFTASFSGEQLDSFNISELNELQCFNVESAPGEVNNIELRSLQSLLLCISGVLVDIGIHSIFGEFSNASCGFELKSVSLSPRN